MNASIFNFFAVTVVSLLILVLRILYFRYGQHGERWLPRELRNAELVYAERFFRSGGDVPIVAKCDRGYRTMKGVIILVELKTRSVNRVYQSDVIELSAQRYAIQLGSRENVSLNGYVLVRQPGATKGTFHSVKLLTDVQIVALAIRRRDILNGACPPEFLCPVGFCKKCAFLRECGGRT